MKRAVITVLGLIGDTKLENFYEDGEIKKRFVKKTEDDKATYTLGVKLKKKYNFKKAKYTNMFPIICELFKDETIIPIYTKKAKEIQSSVLNSENISLNILDFNDGLIEDEKDFTAIFAKIDAILDKYDSVVIDITHGFRHLPILMTINLIIENMKHYQKIEHLLFAKEIIAQKEYELIDLKEYLDISNLSYALSSFNENYTVSNHIRTSNETYNDFLDEMSKFSKHILANSLDALILTTNKKRSITQTLITKIDEMIKEDDKIFKNYKNFLVEIREHISRIDSYKNLPDFKKMLNLAKNMHNKGYLLNSITLLNEALGLFAKEEFKKIDNETKNFIEEFESKVKQRKNNEEKKYQLYSLTDQSKELYKLAGKFRGNFLEIRYPNKQEQKFNEKSEDTTVIIKSYLLTLKNDPTYEKRVNTIFKINSLRNNLAHGNSSKRLEDVESEISKTIKDFEKYFLSSKRVVKDLRKR
jgi:CRISPR-associated DxTHG motif protein